MCAWLCRVYLTCALLSLASDGQYWSGGHYGRPQPTALCPDDDESYSCVPGYQCPSPEQRLNKFFCPWDGRGLVCCQAQGASDTTTQGCGLLHGVRGTQNRILAAVVGGIPRREATTSPWMAAIGDRQANGSTTWYCGGSLINSYTVVTAAHCVVRRRPNVVRLGDLDLSRNNEPNARPEDVSIASITVHPSHRLPSFYNDIALLHLSRALQDSKWARPICLADNSTDAAVGDIATLTGWGYQSFGGDPSDVLHEVSITVYNNSECRTAYSPPKVPAKNFPQGIISSQLCAGDRNGGKDACQGDSGGPLTVKNGNVYTLVGVVSSGIGCGAKSFPGVYTRVSYFVDWINKTLKTKTPPPSKPQSGFQGRPNRFNDPHRYNPYFCPPYSYC